MARTLSQDLSDRVVAAPLRPALKYAYRVDPRAANCGGAWSGCCSSTRRRPVFGQDKRLRSGALPCLFPKKQGGRNIEGEVPPCLYKRTQDPITRLIMLCGFIRRVDD